MPQFLPKHVDYYELDWDQVNTLIKAHFALQLADYDCITANEWMNGTAQTMDLHLAEYDQDERQKIQNLVEGKAAYHRYTHDTRMLLSELVLRAVLPEGFYLIEISW